MSISDTVNRQAYTCNGVTVDFGFAHPFHAKADLVVLKIELATSIQTLLVLTTNYTIAGTQDAEGHFPSGGTITTVGAGSPIPSTFKLVIYRDPALTQGVDLVENDPLPVNAGVESPMDRLTMIALRSREVADRTLRQPDADTNAMAVLPAKDARANQFLAFNATGDPIAIAVPGAGLPVSAFMSGMLDDVDAAEARTTISAPSQAAHDTHVADQAAGIHGGTPAATANKVIQRDASARAQVAAPSVAADIARKDTVDAVQTNLTAHEAAQGAGVHGSTVAATASKLVHRDASGRAQIVDPSVGADIANKTYVDAQVAAVAGVIKSQKTDYSTSSSTTTTFPEDDTIPQNTEGAELFTASYTPLRNDTTIEIEIHVYGSDSATGRWAVGLWVDSQADALAAVQVGSPSVDWPFCGMLVHREASVSISARTYKVRYGGLGGGTVYVHNAAGGGRDFGGVEKSYMLIREYKA